MRIAVTGGLGFIGQNLAMALSRHQGVHLTAIDNLKNPLPSDTAGYDAVLNGCFATAAALRACARADVVVHLAARTTVQDSVRDPRATWSENVIKSQVLLDHLRRHAPRTKLVFASTGGAIIGAHDGAIHEDLPARPLSPYGASKLAVEALLSAHAACYGLNAAALRFSNVYGPRSWRKSSVIAAFCRDAIETQTLTVTGDGRQTRDYIHVDDVCTAIAATIWQDARGVFQLGTGIATSIRDLAEVFRSLPGGRHLRIRHLPSPPGEVRHNRADIRRAEAELGFSPAIDLRDGVAQTFDWFLATSTRQRAATA